MQAQEEAESESPLPRRVSRTWELARRVDASVAPLPRVLYLPGGTTPRTRTIQLLQCFALLHLLLKCKIGSALFSKHLAVKSVSDY